MPWQEAKDGESVSNNVGILHAAINLHKIGLSPKTYPFARCQQFYLLIHG